MPRGQPGEEIYRPETSAADALPRKTVPEASPVSIGPGLEAVGSAIGQKYQADSATWAGDQLADFRLKQYQALEEMKAKQAAGDPGNFTERWAAQFDKQAGPLVEKAGNNPYARAMVNQGLGNLRDTLTQHVMGWESVQRKAYQNDSVDQNLQKQLPLVRSLTNFGPDGGKVAQQIGSTLNDQIQSTSNDPATKLSMLRAVDRQITHHAALGLADSNPGEVYRQLTGSAEGDPAQSGNPILARLIDPASRAEVLGVATGKLVKGTAEGIVGSYREGGPQTGQLAYGSIDKMTLPEEMKDNIRHAVHEGRAALMTEQQEKLAPDLMSVKESLRSGNPEAGTRGRIWELYNSNAVGAEATGSMFGELDAIERRKVDDNAGRALIASAWENADKPNGPKLNPMDPDQKKDASNYFDDLAKANNAPPGSQEWTNIGAEFTRRTGIAPASIGDWARAVFVNQQSDPKQVVAAADAITRVRQASPLSFQYMADEPKLRVMADSISDNTKAGMDGAQAVTIARENAMKGDTERKRIEEAWIAAKPFGHEDTALANVMASQINSDPRLVKQGVLWNSTYPRPYEMQADYKALTRTYFNYNGQNLAEAEKKAARDIGNAWGISEVNGTPELMHFPPERMFRAPDGGPGLTADAVRSDLIVQLDQHPEHFQHWDEEKRALAPFHVEPDKVKLAEIPGVTAGSGGRKWALTYEESPGVHEALYTKDGQLLRYDLPLHELDYAQQRAGMFDKLSREADARYQKRKADESDAMKALALDAAITAGRETMKPGGPK